LAAEDARMKAGLKTAEDELNLIKNQVQQTLLDIREHILDATNPFSAIDDALTDEDEIEFGDDLLGGGGAAGADGADGADGEGGEGEDSESVEGEEGEDDELVDELDDADEGDEEYIEDDGNDYLGDEVLDDDGYGGSGGFGDEEVFEEEEIIPQDEDFELDEEPEAELEGEVDGQVAIDPETGEPVEGALALTANFDVLTMAGLVRWVTVTTSRIGVNRTEILLDAFESAGRISAPTRAVLHHLMALIEEDPDDALPVREIVSAMVRMQGVLDSRDSSPSNQLLGLLLDMDDDPLDHMIA